MAATDMPLRDFGMIEYPYKSYQTLKRWAKAGLIRGVKKDPGGQYVVDMREHHGAANDAGLDSDVIAKLESV